MIRVLFAGSPAIAVPSFEALCREEEVQIAGVLTNPDTPKGRKSEAAPTEVGEAAAKILQGLEGKEAFPVFKTLKPDALREDICALNAGLLVSFAYGRIFSEDFLALFPMGGINVHPSLLPEYRGPTPIQAAILNRDTVTGITVQKLAKELDSGDILAQEELRLTGGETTKTLSDTMAEKAASLLPALVKKMTKGACGTPQEHSRATFCYKIKKEDSFLCWSKSAAEIEAKIRAFDPWPLCRTIHKEKELLLLRAGVYSGKTDSSGQPGLVLGIDKQDGILIQTGEGILSVSCLQYQGKKALEWRDFLNGARDFTGCVLG